jgi:outer membrane protein TolC
MKKGFTRLLLPLFLTLPGIAQQLLTETEAVATALQNSFGIAMLQTDSAANALNRFYAKTAFLPVIQFNTGLQLNNNNQFQKFSDGSERKRNNIGSNNINGNLQLNWTLFNGYRLSITSKKYEAFFQLGRIDIKGAVLNTTFDVLKNYYNIIFQKQVIHAIDEQMKINEERVKLAEQKIKAGLGAKPELLQARLDLNEQKAEKFTQIAALEKLKQKLNQLRNVPVLENFTVPDSIPLLPDIALTDILGNFESGNSGLQAIKKNIEIAKLTYQENKAARYPLVSFNSLFNYNRTDNKAVVNVFSPLFNRNIGMAAGIGVSLPVFNNHAAKQQMQLTSLNLEKLNLDYNDQKAQAEVLIQNTYKDYIFQKQILQLEEENILLAKDNLQIAMERFRAGVTTYIDLRIAQNSLETSYHRLLTARYQTKLSELGLLRLKGY